MAITSGWGSQWETLANAINDYYGGGVSSVQYKRVYEMLNTGNYTTSEMETILKQIPDFERTYNAKGELVRVAYKGSASGSTAAGNVASSINSNAQVAKNASIKSTATITTDSQTGKAVIKDTATKYNAGGASTSVKTVAGDVIGGVAAVAAGISLGKTVDAALYNINPAFWDSRNMQALNPETWDSITSDNPDGTLERLFNFLFQIDETTGNPTPYMSEDALAYIAGYLTEQGAFDPNGGVGETGKVAGITPYNDPFAYGHYPFGSGTEVPSNFTGRVFTVNYTSTMYAIRGNVDSDGYYNVWLTSAEPFTWAWYTQGTTPTFNECNQHTSQGVTAYMINTQFKSDINSTALSIPVVENPNALMCWDIIATGAWSSGTNIEGINDQEFAQVFDASGIYNPDDLQEMIDALRDQYPDLYDNRIEYSPDGQNTYIYYPVGFPTGGTNNQPTSEGANQTDPTPDIKGNSNNATDALVKTLIEIINDISPKMDGDTNKPIPAPNPNPPDGGSGGSPVVTPPTGTASALWKIYNPSQAQLDAFGAWLWSSDFVDQLLKVFNDPMQAIIGLHKVYISPPVSGSGAIKVGYLVSSASANYVSGQYVTVDCGSVNVAEQFKNVFDYDPFTKIRLFLPFIGFVELSNSDVMRGSVNVKYTVDVLTGACLAEVSITRDGFTAMLYQFSGNCAVQYPISSGSYIGIVAGALGIAGGIAGTIASGGALAPMLMGAGASVGAMRANVQHSGSLSPNAGAMGCKKPFIVFERPQTKLPTGGDEIEGMPQNKTVTLSSVSGFYRVKKAKYDGFNGATYSELMQIKALLENGVYSG